jgi:hypothetical protein
MSASHGLSVVPSTGDHALFATPRQHHVRRRSINTSRGSRIDPWRVSAIPAVPPSPLVHSGATHRSEFPNRARNTRAEDERYAGFWSGHVQVGASPFWDADGRHDRERAASKPYRPCFLTFGPDLCARLGRQTVPVLEVCPDERARQLLDRRPGGARRTTLARSQAFGPPSSGRPARLAGCSWIHPDVTRLLRVSSARRMLAPADR